jgi:hypothetical protein
MDSAIRCPFEHGRSCIETSVAPLHLPRRSALIRPPRQRRIWIAAGLVALFSLAFSPRAFADTDLSYAPDCNDPDAHDLNCVEPTQALIQQAREAGYEYYIGHAEPTALFFSSTGTSGYNMQWKFQLPASDPAPTQDGSKVANFQLYSALWMGLALCDPNSNPFGACTATSDANNPSTAGAAVLELQFFPPPDCGGTNDQWCALLHINTLQNATKFQVNNCLEPTTAQNVTTDGTPGGPKLLMSSGDSILVTIHDTANGIETDVDDLTSAATGSMVASGANGFVHNANQTDCTTTPFDFHAMYATASPGQGVPWASLGLNVGFDFEIGHYELCGDSSCSTLPDGGDEGTCSVSTNQLCKVDGDCPMGETCNVQTVASCGTVRGVGGCFDRDLDQDGTSYQADWPDGTAAHPSSVILGSADDRGVGPLSTSTTSTNTYDEGYNTITFRTTEGTSAPFYPFFSQAGTGASCRFNFGNDIPGTTTNDFGKAAQYGTTITNPCLPGTPPIALCTDTTVPTDPNLCSAASASIDNGSSDPDGDPVTLSQSPDAPYPLGTTPVTLTVTEPEGTASSCMANVTVVDKQAPSISCPSPVAECTSPSGAVVTFSDTVFDNCPGVQDLGCTPPSGSTFPLGKTPFTCNARDGSGNTNACSSAVVVQDTTPPTVSVSLSQTLLWPPNHNLVNVGFSATVSDVCDPNPSVKVLVFGNEDDQDPTGDGVFSPDAKDIAFNSLRLREERKGNGTGRVYLLVVQATDASGNLGIDCGTVVVPHDQAAAAIASVNAQAAAAKAFCLANNGTAPAGYVVVGDGPVIGPKQ